jgi:Ca2+/Na+ antiporter
MINLNVWHLLVFLLAQAVLVLYFVRKGTPATKPKKTEVSEENEETPSGVNDFFSQILEKLSVVFKKAVPFWRVIFPFLMMFLILHLISEWTNYTVAKINPLAIVFNNEMNQFWIAAKRFVFINGFVIAFIMFAGYLPFWASMKETIDEIKTHYKDLESWEKIKLYLWCIFGFGLEFIFLLQASLPVGSTLGR